MSDRMKLYIETMIASVIIVIMAIAGVVVMAEMLQSGDYVGPLGVIVLTVVGLIFFGGAIHAGHAAYRAYKEEVWVIQCREMRESNGYEW